MAIPVLGKIIKAFVGPGGVLDANNVETPSDLTGVLSGVTDVETSLRRIDGTGVGADVHTYTGDFSAANDNIDVWFGNKQLVRLRCTGRGGLSAGALPFNLPGTLALNAAFDALQNLGIAQRLQFIIEYTGAADSYVSIRPRVPTSPQIMGASSIQVRSGVAATLEITRTAGVISDYTFQNIGLVGGTGTGTVDAIKLINPSTAVWDASQNGTLPTTGVVKGNAYKVVNAPPNNSGRFNEVMATDDWVVWSGETFTSWVAEPHQWFVLPAHDVRRISALEQDFLTDISESPVSDRNSVVRGANYADTAAEIRIKMYDSVDDYSAADLNTTGQIDQFTQASDTTGVIAVRLAGTQATLANVLPTLFLYADDVLVGGFALDASYRGDFGAESDYIFTTPFNYTANQVLRVYLGTTLKRYGNLSLDIEESNLSEQVQQKLNRTDPPSGSLLARLNAVESKINALFPLTPDVSKLVDFSDIYNDSQTVETVNITPGYSLIADYRGDSERYESAGVTYDNSVANVVQYSGLGESYQRVFGFGVSAPADKTLLSVVDGSDVIPYVDITAGGNIRINNYRTDRVPGQEVQNEFHFLTRTAGDTVLRRAADSVQTFTLTNYPTGATNGTREVQIDLDVYLNGSDSLAGHLANIDAPDTNEAAAKQTLQASIPLGPLYNNRTVTVTIGYTFRVSGSDLLVDFTLDQAPSDVTIDMADVATILNYTAADTASRTDNFVTLTDLGGDYTFTGAVDFLLAFHPIANTNIMEVVPGVITADGTVSLLNDPNTPEPVHGFSVVEIPDDINFTTFLSDHFFIHRDLQALLPRRGTHWAYGLALREQVAEQRITETVNFTQGLTSKGRAVPEVFEGDGAPTVDPGKIGDFYIDTTGKNVYQAVGTSSGDWVQLNGSA